MLIKVLSVNFVFSLLNSMQQKDTLHKKIILINGTDAHGRVSSLDCP